MSSTIIGFGGFILFVFFGLFFLGFRLVGGVPPLCERIPTTKAASLDGALDPARFFSLPLCLWALMNIGLSFDLGPFVPLLQFVRGKADWMKYYMTYMGAGFCLIASYWCAVTLAWVIWHAKKGLEGEMRQHYRGLAR